MARVQLTWIPVEGRAAQRAAVERLLGPTTRMCPHCGSTAHGRPRVPGKHLSLAYTEDGVLVALAEAPVGVDIEIGGEIGGEELAAWVRAEAILKAQGTGLRRPPEDVGSDAEEGVRTATRTIGSHVLAVAVLDPADLVIEWSDQAGSSGSGSS